ncbi:hypothetical protein Dimus_029963, partial [Dionaea muscipula]
MKSLDEDPGQLPAVDKDATLPHLDSSPFIDSAMDDKEVADPLLEIEPDLSPHPSTVPLLAEPTTHIENQTDMHPSSNAPLDGQHSGQEQDNFKGQWIQLFADN